MLKNEILDIIYVKDKLISNRIYDNFFKKNYSILYEKIIKLFPNTKFNIAIYCIINDISEIPKCKYCGNILNNLQNFSFKNGFRSYCNIKCMHNDPKLIEKRKETILKKYKTDSVFKSKVIKKRKETILKKYGVEYITQSEHFKKKSKITKKKKYGNENYANIEKAKKTNLEKYGVETTLLVDDVKEKIKKTVLKKYGVDHISKSEAVIEKRKQKNLEKYGVESTLSLDEVWDKIKQTNITKYGVEYPLQSSVILNKIKENNLDKYGNENPATNINIINKINKTKENTRILKIANKLNIDSNNIEIIDGDFIKIKNYCDKHSEFTISKFLYKNRMFRDKINICTKCNEINSKQSKIQAELINYIEQYYHNNILKNDREILNGYEIDIFLPEINIGFEFNGNYWHSDINHEKNYHYNKKNLAKLKNIDLFFIWEHDYKKNNEIIKSIIKSNVNIYDKIINSRDCDLITLNQRETNEFLDKNHLSGSVLGNYNLGLTHENNIVSMASFNEIGDNEFEITRFCNVLDINVIDSLKKILNNFIYENKPKKIEITLDRDYYKIDEFLNVGFTLNEITLPDYSYFKNGNRLNKNSCTKEILINMGFDSNKTEYEIMTDRKYYRNYNSGNYKLSLNIN
ncbi:MAG: DUF7487 domain-containing protein [bacterium]